MSRPKREPTAEEIAIMVRMRSEWARPLKEVQAVLAAECGNPPSIGLLHRWTTELQEEIGAAITQRYAGVRR